MSSPILAAHLDLKGMMPRPTYVREFLRDLVDQGFNALLVEYEDCFPFRGMKIAADRATRWSREYLAKFLADADRLGIEIIPLQQCLGHLEYVFRWPAYAKLTEDVRRPGTVRLANPEAKALVLDMLSQMIAAHPNSRFIHLGMDEAYALSASKRLKGRDVLEVFLEYLGELCEVCQRAGKTPMIWSDMLEDHFRPADFARFRDRVILVPWDYSTRTPWSNVGRLAGLRVSKRWLDEPENPAAPAMGSGHRFIEDFSPGTRKLIAPSVRGRQFRSMFQADLWTRMGFRVIGAGAARMSADGAMMPRYLRAFGNTRQWAAAARRNQLMGVLCTSWARSGTLGPPNAPMETAWPCLSHFAREMVARPRAFWAGVSAKEIESIFARLGRCREDWWIEGELADRMMALAPRIKRHRYEWDAIVLMTRTFALHRQVESLRNGLILFRAGPKLPRVEIDRRRRDVTNLLRELSAMRRAINAHFRRRYHGQAYRQWLCRLFDAPMAELRAHRRELLGSSPQV